MGFLGGVIYVYAIFISFFKTVVYTKHIMMVKKNNLKFLNTQEVNIMDMTLRWFGEGVDSVSLERIEGTKKPPEDSLPYLSS